MPRVDVLHLSLSDGAVARPARACISSGPIAPSQDPMSVSSLRMAIISIWSVGVSDSTGLLIHETQKFITRQPPIRGKDDYDSENSWISDVLPSHSKKKERRQRHHKEQISWRRQLSRGDFSSNARHDAASGVSSKVRALLGNG